jgi:hypothetical protein
VVVKDKQLGAGVFHQVPAEVVDQKGNVGGLAAAIGSGERDGVPAFVVEEHLEAAPGCHHVSLS